MNKVNIKKQNPAFLIEAYLMQIIPPIIIFITFLIDIIFEKHFLSFLIGNNIIFLSIAFFHFIIGIGLYFNNIIAWWGAFIWPITLFSIITYCIVWLLSQPDCMSGPMAMILISVNIIFGFYNGIIMWLLTRPNVKALFNKSKTDIVD